MIRRNLIAVSVVAASLFTSQAIYAAPVTSLTSVHAMFGKGKTKTIQLSLRNDSTAPMEVLVGDKATTIPAGKSVALSLPAGTKILTNDTTPMHQSGKLIAEVGPYFSGTTIALK